MTGGVSQGYTPATWWYRTSRSSTTTAPSPWAPCPRPCPSVSTRTRPVTTALNRARGNQPPNSNVRVSGVVTHGVNGAYPGNIVGGKQKYAMVCISNGTAKTAVIENCTVNDADFAYNTEEMASTTTHFVSCTAVNCECGNRLLCRLDPCGWPLTLGRCCGQRRSTPSSCNPACSRR